MSHHANMGCDACSAALSLARLAALSLAICAFSSGVNCGCATGASGNAGTVPLTSASRASSSSSTSSSSWLDILFARSSLISWNVYQHTYYQRLGYAAHLLISTSLLVLTQQLLYVLDAAHFLVDLLENCRSLLQTKQDILLHQGELDVAGEDLQLR